MDNQTYNSIVSFIWGIADDCLRDVYVRGKYRDVILPMTVIRRLDAVLEETKDEVLKLKAQLDAAGVANQTNALCSASKQAFCNSSPFRLRDLTSRANQQKLKADFALSCLFWSARQYGVQGTASRRAGSIGRSQSMHLP